MTDAPQPPGDADGDDFDADGELRLSPSLIIAVSVALLIVAGIVVSFVSGQEDETSSPPTLPPSGSPTAPAPPAGPPGATTPPGGPTAPPGGPTPSSRPPLRTFPGKPPGQPTDSFDRPNGPLAAPWRTTGTWEVQNRALKLTKGDPKEFVFAVRDLTSPDGVVSATLRGPASSGGVVLRYTDPKNYLVISPAVQKKQWILVKVVNGKAEVLKSFWPAPVVTNTVLTVTMKGEKLQVSLNGKDLGTATTDFNVTAKGAGFRAKVLEGAPTPRWDDFYGA